MSCQNNQEQSLSICSKQDDLIMSHYENLLGTHRELEERMVTFDERLEQGLLEKLDVDENYQAMLELKSKKDDLIYQINQLQIKNDNCRLDQTFFSNQEINEIIHESLELRVEDLYEVN